MQVVVLASGSKGNAVMVEMDGVKLLIDAGISATRIKKGLAGFGMAPEPQRSQPKSYQTSSIIAISAASPRRGPILVMRV